MSASTPYEREFLLNLETIPSVKPKARQSRLDSLAWSAGLSFTAYGVRIGLRSNRAAALEDIVARLPLGWKASSSPVVDTVYSILCNEAVSADGESAFYLYKDNHQLFQCASREGFLDRLESDLALHVAENTQRRVFVHAGVVGWGSHAILIPGRSFSGKTTLVAALIRAGAAYYSDEFAVLDDRGMVHPYPRPLQVRETGAPHQTRRRADEFGAMVGRVPLPVGLVLLSRYKAGAKWRPRHLSAGQAMLGILDNTVSARRGPAAALKTLKEVVGGSFAVKGIRGEGHEVVDWISTYFHPQKMFATGE
ncbi:MAG TPA: hypothetical protein VGR96_05625 [Acidobacteriaceae bacterium]|nr:hypothetical protein [Acidobacteriaceae bacterium]